MILLIVTVAVLSDGVVAILQAFALEWPTGAVLGVSSLSLHQNLRRCDFHLGAIV